MPKYNLLSEFHVQIQMPVTPQLIRNLKRAMKIKIKSRTEQERAPALHGSHPSRPRGRSRQPGRGRRRPRKGADAEETGAAGTGRGCAPATKFAAAEPADRNTRRPGPGRPREASPGGRFSVKATPRGAGGRAADRRGGLPPRLGPARPAAPGATGPGQALTSRQGPRGGRRG